MLAVLADTPRAEGGGPAMDLTSALALQLRCHMSAMAL